MKKNNELILREEISPNYPWKKDGIRSVNFQGANTHQFVEKGKYRKLYPDKIHIESDIVDDFDGNGTKERRWVQTGEIRENIKYTTLIGIDVCTDNSIGTISDIYIDYSPIETPKPTPPKPKTPAAKKPAATPSKPAAKPATPTPTPITTKTYAQIPQSDWIFLNKGNAITVDYFINTFGKPKLKTYSESNLYIVAQDSASLMKLNPNLKLDANGLILKGAKLNLVGKRADYEK